MVEDINNPGVTPTPPTPEYGRDKPGLGSGEEAQEPKPFSLPPEAGKEGAPVEANPSEKPSPMDMARENAGKTMEQMSPEQLGDHLNKLKTQLSTAQNNLQDPSVTSKFADEHYQALNKLVDKMNPDIRNIAKNSQGEFNPPQHMSGEPALNYITRWINGSQETLSSALNYVGKQKDPNPADFLKLQYSVQRAVQRGELFASIVGGTVSGIKTLMSTQLG
ncbi:MAG: hypothetical protein S4CHLAM2_04380 [Chlamydiales bacterium]|nr:hypothetical protein [Chlamydiales bacterium]